MSSAATAQRQKIDMATASLGIPALDQALTVQQVATLSNLSVNYVYILVRRGALPAVRHGRAIRVRREDFDRWMQPSPR